MKARFALVFGVAALGLTACQQPFAGPQTGAEGAAVGALGGAAAGQVIGGDTQSTVAGATLGAIGGGLAGTATEQRRIEQQQQAVQQPVGTRPAQVIR